MNVSLAISIIGLLITIISILIKFVVDNAKTNNKHDIYIEQNKKEIQEIKNTQERLIQVNEKYLEKFHELEIENKELRGLYDRSRKGDYHEKL